MPYETVLRHKYLDRYCSQPRTLVKEALVLLQLASMKKLTLVAADYSFICNESFY